MAESIRVLRHRLRRIEEDIAESRDRVDWYEKRIGDLEKRRENLVEQLGGGPKESREPDEESAQKESGGEQGFGGLASLLGNIDPKVVSQAMGLLGGLGLGGLASGGSGAAVAGGDEAETEGGVEDPPSFAQEDGGSDDGGTGGIPDLSSLFGGGKGGIMDLIGKVAAGVGAGRGGGGGVALPAMAASAAPGGNPLDGISEILSFAKAGHFKNRSINMEDLTGLVNLARSPGVRSLVSTASQLANGVAAFRTLNRAMKSQGNTAGARRRGAGPSTVRGLPLELPALASENAVQIAGPVLDEEASVPPQFRMKVARRESAPKVALPVSAYRKPSSDG